MKTLGISCVTAGMVALTVISCSKTAAPEGSASSGNGVLVVEAFAPQVNQPDTKVTLNPTDLIKWYSSDKSYAGLFVEGKGIVKSTTSGSSISADGQQATFNFSSSKITSFSSDAARVVYPCTSESSSTSLKYTFSVPSEQSLSSKAGSSSSYGSNAVVPMISDAFSVKSSYKEAESYYGTAEWYATASAKMHLLTSIVAFYVYDSEGQYSGEKVKSIELQSSSSNISGSSTTSLTSDNQIPVLEGTSRIAKAQFSYSSNYFSLSGITSKEKSSPIYLSIVPAVFAGSVVVTTDKASYIFPFENPKTFTRAEVKDFYLNLSNPKVQRVEPTSCQITKIYREKVSGKTGRMVTMTVKLSDNAAGFYAYIGTTAIKTAADIVKSQFVSKYTVGQDDDDSFTLNSDGTVDYKKFLSSNFTFSVLPYDENGVLGIGQRLGSNSYGYDMTYNVTAADGYVSAIEDDIVPFNN